MKNKFTLAVMTALLAIGLSSAAAHADTVMVSLGNPTQYVGGAAGGTVTYEFTLSAPASNGAPIFLNGDSFNVGAPLVLDDTDFFTDSPVSLAPGDTATFDAFTVTVPAGTTPGDYSGFFTILGGIDNNAGDPLGTFDFVTVVTPEPGSFLLLGSGLAGLVGVVRRKRSM